MSLGVTYFPVAAPPSSMTQGIKYAMDAAHLPQTLPYNPPNPAKCPTGYIPKPGTDACWDPRTGQTVKVGTEWAPIAAAANMREIAPVPTPPRIMYSAPGPEETADNTTVPVSQPTNVQTGPTSQEATTTVPGTSSGSPAPHGTHPSSGALLAGAGLVALVVGGVLFATRKKSGGMSGHRRSRRRR